MPSVLIGWLCAIVLEKDRTKHFSFIVNYLCVFMVKVGGKVAIFNKYVEHTQCVNFWCVYCVGIVLVDCVVFVAYFVMLVYMAVYNVLINLVII